MYLLKKIMPIFILLFSFQVSASEEITSNCANSDGQIEPFSFEICKEDLVLRSIYQLFPETVETLIENYNIEDAKKIKDDERFQILINTSTFGNVIKIVNPYLVYLAKIILFILFLYLIYQGFVRSLSKEGEFFGGEGEFRNGIVIIVISSFFLITYQDITIAQYILISIVFLAVALGNFVMGFVLYAETAINNYSESKITDSIENVNNNDAQNLFVANTDIKKLARIDLCRRETSRYIIDSNFYDSKEDFEKIKNCAMPNSDKIIVSGSSNDSEVSFFNYYLDDKKEGFKTVNKIQFGLTKTDSCPADVQRYSCGEVNLVSFNSENTQLLKFIPEFYYDSLSNVISSLGDDSKANYKIINDGWVRLESKIPQALKVYKNKIKNSGNVTDSIDMLSVDKILAEGNNTEEIKELLYAYHQDILNALMFSTPIFTKNETSSSIDLKNNGNSLFTDRYKDIKSMSLLLNEYKCLSQSNLKESLGFESKMMDGYAQVTTNCLDFASGEVLGLNKGEFFTEEEMRDRKDQLLSEISVKNAHLVGKLKGDRDSVELSMMNALNQISSTTTSIKIRQGGFISMGSNFFKRGENLDRSLNFKRMLLNSIQINISKLNERLISNDVYDVDLAESLGFGWYAGKNDVISDLIKFQNIPQGYNSSLDLQDALTGNMKSLNSGSIDIFQFIKLLGDPMFPIRSGLGFKISNSDGSANKECSVDLSKCPIIDGNAFDKIAKTGRYMVNNSISYFTTVIVLTNSVKTAKNAIFKNDQKNIDKDSFIGEHNRKNKFGKVVKSTTKASTKTAIIGLESIGYIIGILNIFAILMLILGVVLAYLIPLMPFMYSFIGFIEWIIKIIGLFFVMPVFCAMIIKYSDNSQSFKSFIITYFIQILTKPIFLVTALFFVSIFYNVFLFGFNITIGDMINNSTGNDGFIMDFVYLLGSAIIIILFLYQSTKKIFDLIGDIPNQMIQIIGGDAASNDNRTVSELTEYMYAKFGFNKYSKLKREANKINFGENSVQMNDKIIEQMKENREVLQKHLKSENPNFNAKELKDLYKTEIAKKPEIYGFSLSDGKFVDLLKEFGSKMKDKMSNR